MNAPCYKCPDRHEGCHNEQCPYGYMEFKARMNRLGEAKQKTQDADAHTKETIERNSKRAQTRKQVGQR